VQSVFLVGGRLLAAVDVQVQPADSLLIGQSVRVVSADYRIVPVALIKADGQTAEQLTAARLMVGDRLMGISALSDLERLLSRSPVQRDQAVEVTAHSAEHRELLLRLLKDERGLEAQKAEKLLDNLPICVAEHVSIGRAEELADALRGRGVQCTVHPMTTNL
jgi:hypothetical protein